jgi:hypothetical protein
MNDTTTAIPTDALLELAADRRRRVIIEYLREQDGEAVPLPELVDAIGGGEYLPVELRHVHLPKLDDAGLVVYDAGTAIVSYGVDDDRVERLVDFVARELE